jgi:hypothetical protein
MTRTSQDYDIVDQNLDKLDIDELFILHDIIVKALEKKIKTINEENELLKQEIDTHTSQNIKKLVNNSERAESVNKSV